MRKFKQFPSKLQCRAHELLVNTKITNKKIAEDTGLSEAWLSDFVNLKLKHASVSRIETLYNYLSPVPLNV